MFGEITQSFFLVVNTAAVMPEETKIFYYIGDEQTPYVSKINIPPDVVTLGDFKAAIKKPNYKFFFRSTDADFGVVKEEITNDQSVLPLCENRIVAWLVQPESDSNSQYSSGSTIPRQDASKRSSIASHVSDLPPNMGGPMMSDGLRKQSTEAELPPNNHSKELPPSRHMAMMDRYGSQSTIMSSDIESSISGWDSRDDESEYSTFSEMTASSRHRLRYNKRHKFKKKRPKPCSDTTSTYSSSITDSSLSLNILSVTLNMEKYNFLGISIVGQSNDKGDGGIYIGSIMKGGAVAADGRIEPGDMLLQVNEVNFENMSNEDAVRVLRNIVHKPGPITLTVAKCWDPTPESNYFTIPKNEPVRPIDPAAWANHIMAVRDGYPAPGVSPPYSTNQETSSASSLPESERYETPLSIHTDMAVVVKTLKMPDSGLDVKTRMWLKITIPNAFIGSDLIDWLQTKVEGLQERRAARKYASSLLKAGYIRHTVNKITFSEQCYYVFGEYTGSGLAKDMVNLSLADSNSDRDSDTLGSLPMVGGPGAPWGMGNRAGAPAHGFTPFNQYNSGGGGPIPQAAVPPMPHHPVQMNPGNPMVRGTANAVLDYTVPPPAYTGGTSDIETISVQSDRSGGLVIQQSPQMHPPPNATSSHQHLASFGANSNGSGISVGSGSDQQSVYSNRSGDGCSTSSSTGKQQLNVVGSSSRSRSDSSEKSNETMQSQLSGSVMLGGGPHSSNFSMHRPLPPPPPAALLNQQLPPPPIPMRPSHRPSPSHQHQQPQSSSGQPPQGRPLGAVPQDVSGSRQSFQKAMGNPCDYFVGVM